MTEFTKKYVLRSVITIAVFNIVYSMIALPLVMAIAFDPKESTPMQRFDPSLLTPMGIISSIITILAEFVILFICLGKVVGRVPTYPQNPDKWFRNLMLIMLARRVWGAGGQLVSFGMNYYNSMNTARRQSYYYGSQKADELIDYMKDFFGKFCITVLIQLAIGIVVTIVAVPIIQSRYIRLMGKKNSV